MRLSINRPAARFDYFSLGVAFCVAAPIAYVLFHSLQKISSVLGVYPAEMWVAAVLKTAGLMLGSAAIALATGTASAFLLHRYKWPMQKLWKFSAVIPLAVPAHLYALAALSYLDPQGYLQSFLREAGLNIYWDPKSFVLLCLTVGISLSPYCYLFMLGAMRRQDLQLEDSAKLLRPKARWLKGLWGLRLALLAPPAAASIWFVALDSFGNLGASVVLGQDTLMTLIYDTWTGLYSFESAISLSMVSLSVFGFLFFISSNKAMPQNTQRSWNKSKPKGKTAAFGFLFLGLFFLVSTALPLALFILQSFRQLTGPANLQRLISQLLYSTGLAVVVAMLCAFFGMLLVFNQHRLKTPRWLVEIGYTAYALPGLIYGVSIYLVYVAGLKLFGLQQSILFSFLILLFALSAKFFAVSSKSVHSILSYQPAELMESALLLHKSWPHYFKCVFWRGTRPAWFSGSILIILEVLKEVPITMVLRPYGFQSLSTEVFDLTAEGFYGRASLPALALVCLGFLFLYLLDPESRDS